jgi:hypothetical protein
MAQDTKSLMPSRVCLTPAHYTFLGQNREALMNHPLLFNDGMSGAQITYSWRSLEPVKDQYDFSDIEEDLALLSLYGKKLWVQLQITSFYPEYKHVPDYLLEESAYQGGVTPQYTFTDDELETGARHGGWVAMHWNPAVAQRYHLLIKELGKVFDGRIEGINLQETAVDFGSSGRYFPPNFTYEIYRDAVILNMTVLAKAFKTSKTLQYINFMPGEWLPDTDMNLNRSLYNAAVTLGVGVGGPDLIPGRRGQEQHIFTLMPLYRPYLRTVGIAVQEGNLSSSGTTANTAQHVYNEAVSRLKPDYIFWGTEEPFYSNEILPMTMLLYNQAASASLNKLPAHNKP